VSIGTEHEIGQESNLQISHTSEEKIAHPELEEHVKKILHTEDNFATI